MTETIVLQFQLHEAGHGVPRVRIDGGNLVDVECEVDEVHQSTEDAVAELRQPVVVQLELDEVQYRPEDAEWKTLKLVVLKVQHTKVGGDRLESHHADRPKHRRRSSVNFGRQDIFAAISMYEKLIKCAAKIML